jgi:peptide/nickel transport system permease protein
MTKFIVQSIISTISTLFLVSISLFFLTEVGGGDIALKILGVFSTPEQRASFRGQLGLDAPPLQRYVDWLIGNDWRVDGKIGHDLVTLPNPKTQETQWWAKLDDQYVRWQFKEGELWRLVRRPDGQASKIKETSGWKKDAEGNDYFWGIDKKNNAVKWLKAGKQAIWVLSSAGLREESGGGVEFIPLRKGLIRGDAGLSMQYNRPVSNLILPRIRNTIILAGCAFVVVMPLALLLGILAGINEGKLLDRIVSVVGLSITAIPEFVTGIFLILVFGIWFKVLPAVTLFLNNDAVFENPKMLILPVLTLTAIELGYVARMTRASMVEVMDSAYIRTAFVKGMPFKRVVFRHALRNALLAPITVIMLHVNWLVGGVVVTEVIFAYPGLGKYIYDAAIFGDTNAVEAAAMVTVGIAIVTRLAGDMIYTLLNPRIRYA